MRLRRVEAVRYGALTDRTLGELSEGLTVVVGRNEAGKSTLASLVRHVLYGFPTPASKDDEPYLSDAGDREGRLVFGDGEGEWVVRRVQGPHGGPVETRALSGPEKPDLLSKLTAGVSARAYRVVFGFGLEEMADIERAAEGDDVLGHLYAASAGLAVSPGEARKSMTEAADGLFRPRGRREINELLSRLSEIRKGIRKAQEVNDAYQDVRDRASGLAEEVAALRSELQRSRDESAVLQGAGERLERIERERNEVVESLAGLRSELTAAERQVETLAPDAEVLKAAAASERALSELSADRERHERIRELEARVADSEEQALRIAARTGAAPDELLPLAVDGDLKTEVEGWREAIRRLEIEAETAARAAEESRLEAEAAEREARQAKTSEGARRPREALASAFLLAAAGVAVGVSGMLAASFALAGLGAVLLASAVALLVMPGSSSPSSPEAGRAEERARQASGRSEDAEKAARLARGRLDERSESWDRWRAARNLPGSDCSSVLAAISASREALSADEARARAASEADRLRETCASFAEALREAAAFISEQPDDVERLAEEVRRRLEAAREGARRREEAERRAEETRAAIAAQTGSLQRLEEEKAEIGRVIGKEDPTPELVSALLVQRREAAEELAARYDSLARELGAIEERLASAAGDAGIAELKLEESAVLERLRERGRRYAELRVADALLARAQERYEMESQPQVVRRAGEILREVTGERYVKLRVPLGGEVIEVLDAAAGSKETRYLSTGTAQQLYLALRIALIEQLDGIGVGLPVLMDDVFANFDPQRAEEAARAVAELATRRQVVFMTCHPRTAEMFEQVAPEHLRVQL